MTNSSVGLGAGFGASGVAAIFFGSTYVPVKRFETGDGLFFQFVMCNAILLAGVVVDAVRRFPQFHPLVMLGGAMWATGNVCVVAIAKMIGLGLGVLIWSISNMLCGWASGRFGLFGLHQEVPPRLAFNYAGVVLCGVSGLLYMFVRSEVSSGEATQLEMVEAYAVNGQRGERQQAPSADFFERLSPWQKRVIGCVLAVASGVLYGFQFVPYLYVSQQYDGASQNALDYVFAQFVGSYLASLVYMLIYAAAMKNNPRLYPRAVLPGVACGLMWSVADVCWFIANEALGETISYPIITTSPPVITNLWTILLFREIRGRRNFAILGLAFLITCLGVAFIVVSKLG